MHCFYVMWRNCMYYNNFHKQITIVLSVFFPLCFVFLCIVSHFNVAYISGMHLSLGQQEFSFSKHCLLWWLSLPWLFAFDRGVEAVNQAMWSHLQWTRLISCSDSTTCEYALVSTIWLAHSGDRVRYLSITGTLKCKGE